VIARLGAKFAPAWASTLARLSLRLRGVVVVVLTAAALGAFWTLILGQLDALRAALLNTAERDARALASAVAGHAARSLRAIEHALADIDAEMYRNLGVIDLTEYVERRRDLVGLLDAVIIYDEDGQPIEASRIDGLAGQAVADRRDFVALQRGQPGALALGAPLKHPESGAWLIPFGRRLDWSDGSFRGALVAYARSDFFQRFYLSIDIGPEGLVALHSVGGALLALPDRAADAIGRAETGHPLMEKARAGAAGTHRGPGLVDGVPRLHGFVPIDGHPIVASVGLAEATVLAPYEAQRQSLVWQAAGASVLATALAALLFLQFGGRERDRTDRERADQRIRDAIDRMNDAFMLLDPDDRVQLYNERLLAFFPELAGTTSIVGLTFEQLLRRAIEGGGVTHRARGDIETWFAWRMERHRMKDAPFEQHVGPDRWLLTSERATSDGGTVIVWTDITRLKQQEQALREKEEQRERVIKELEAARAAAEAANLAKSNFLANISHELRTPLNAIIGFSDVMRGQMLGPMGTQRYVDYASDIHGSGRHLLALINDILDMARIEAGKMQLYRERVDIADLAHSCARMVAGLAQEAQIDMTVTAAERDLVIDGDARALRQVLLNLLSNAVKFNRAGGKVSVGARREGNQVMLTVTDTGIGIPKEDLGRIGLRFVRVESPDTRKVEGTGLGLSLSRALVELHGGTLEIASTEGEGTTVTVRLPVAATPAAGAQAAAS
jgi:signal transduction histidine kinase